MISEDELIRYGDTEWAHLARQLNLCFNDLEFRSNEFERRKKFYLLCFCAIASCVGVLTGVITFLLMGVIY